MPQHRRGKRIKKERAGTTRLDKDLAEHLVQSRDRVEAELAQVRPIVSKRKRVKREEEEEEVAPGKKRRRKGQKEGADEAAGDDAAAAQPAPVDPLNPLGESVRFRRKRTQGRRHGGGPPGPGVAQRAKEIRDRAKAGAGGMTGGMRLLHMIAERSAVRKKAKAA
eukprot:TRINITY_DN1913_c0_g1_i6.p2 TRINITY_DN1913_c0_g1~~TRINITY_DN1913_c0_g1_i6.p2  ORF type:complete len:165 (+),score=41.68 TRINITY_DN1913_c0_g1_i6:59-553(+)